MRILLPLLLLTCGAAAFLLHGCGDGPEGGAASPWARVRILTAAEDGPMQGTVRLEALEDGVEKVYDATPLPEDSDVHVAEGAPPGQYYVYSSEGWGMLWGGVAGSSLPHLRGADHPAQTVRLGKPNSLYVAAIDPRLDEVGERWGAEWKVAAEGGRAAFQPADVTCELQVDGFVAIRFPPEVWKAGHLIRACGLFRSGAVSQLISFQKRDPVHERLPRVTFTTPSPQAPLTVHLVPPPGVAAVPDGTRVKVTLTDVPLAVTFEEASHVGRVRFETIGSLGHGLAVTIPGSGLPALPIDQETWRTRGEMHVVSLAKETAAQGVAPAGVREVRVRFAGGDRYGRVPLLALDDASTFWTAPGAQHCLVRLEDGTWAEAKLTASTAGPVELSLGEGRKPARVRGKVDGGGRGFRVQVTLLTQDEAGEDLEVTGDGLSASVDHYGVYVLSIPPGRYRIQVLRPGGVPVRPITLPAFKQGQDVLLDLKAR